MRPVYPALCFQGLVAEEVGNKAPPSSPVHLTAACPPALDGKACLSLSISAEGVAGGQAAITGHPALWRVILMECRL